MRQQTNSPKLRGFPTASYLPLLVCVSLFVAGCGSSTEDQRPKETAKVSKPVAAKVSEPKKKKPPEEKPEIEEQPGEKPPAKAPNYAAFADLLKQPVDSMPRMTPEYQRIAVDDAKAKAEGIRKLVGKRIVLYTDLEGAEIEGLPAIFDLAFPQYCEYFEVDPAPLDEWRATAFLMKDKERFVRAELMPDYVPKFKHGFSVNYDIWLNEQPNDYYRRHLLLHEGVHSFMNTTLGGCGAPWYMEGMAEMLSTHSWRDGRLTLNYFPAGREEVPELGRIWLIRDAYAKHRALPLVKIIEFPGSAHFSNEAYAWSWGAAKFLDTHPRYRERFRQLHRYVLAPDFNEKFYLLFAKDLPELYEEWQVFVVDLEYGYDIPRTAIDFAPGMKKVEDAGIAATVAADRRWQNSGIRLEAGRKYQLTGSGKWEKKCNPAFWSGIEDLPEKVALESNGISIRYYRGQPLGILMAAVRPDRPSPEKPSVFLQPTIVGSSATIEPEQSGTLFFKLNDSAADLSGNSGGISVEIK
jgi:hypothetical protein